MHTVSMCTGVSVEQWRAAVGAMAAVAHTRCRGKRALSGARCEMFCTNTGKLRKARRQTLWLSLCFSLLLLSSTASPHDDCYSKEFKRVSCIIPPLNISAVGRFDRRNHGRKSCEQRVQATTEPLVSVSGLLPVLCFLMVLVQKLLLMCGDVEPNPGPTTVTIDDLEKLMKELQNVGHKWFAIGKKLLIPEQSLLVIDSQCSDNDSCLKEMLSSWLKLPSGIKTWEILCEALSTEGEMAIGKSIKSRYANTIGDWV